MSSQTTINRLLTLFEDILDFSTKSGESQYKLMTKPGKEMSKFDRLEAKYEKLTSLILERLCNLNSLETLDTAVERTHMAVDFLLEQATYLPNIGSSQK